MEKSKLNRWRWPGDSNYRMTMSRNALLKLYEILHEGLIHDERGEDFHFDWDEEVE